MSRPPVTARTPVIDIVEEIPPQAMFRRLGASMTRKVPRRRRDAAIELAHWGYGASGGALYGLLPARIRQTPWGGPTYGLLLWIGFELGIAPLLGISRRRKTGRRREALALAADHALYGLVLSEIRPAHKAMR
jgi:hypothetical protein